MAIRARGVTQDLQSAWTIPRPDLLEKLNTSPSGLTQDEADKRIGRYGPNQLKKGKRSDPITLLLAQFKSPIILILIFAGTLSFFLADPATATIILVIILVSALLGFWQENGATRAVERLLAIVQTKATVIRDGIQKDITLEEIVPGDIVVLNAGDLVPGDCQILESKDLYANEAPLTGETFPVEKAVAVLPSSTPLSQRVNSLFMGTNVVSGNSKTVVVETGVRTEFGKVSERLELRPPETEFEHGVKHFGYLLLEITLVLVVATLAINVYLKRDPLQSLLFSVALAVGLTPQLLPAIISVNLARGARQMADQKVIVKRLASIENFGSMNVLCSDKTGTLTQGLIRMKTVVDYAGQECDKALLYAYLNASYQTGFTNPIDEAIRSDETVKARNFDLGSYQKLDEVPYDFVRKRLSVLVSKGPSSLIITKGALQNILDVCKQAETYKGDTVELDEVRDQIQQQFEGFSKQGYRVLGISYKDTGNTKIINKNDENNMIFAGFLVLYDPIKPGVTDVVNELKELGISLKIITGDNKLVAASVSQQVGLPAPRVVTGTDLRNASDEALLEQVNSADLFAEVEPNQKERIILALKKTGNVVGYMGDGINDASALHAADIGLSVDDAVDVAKEAADIVLLQKDLGVLASGVKEGRRTFANTMKYVFMATSANFGNMFSMAGASLFLSFLPLLPTQILLTNLMTDFPETTIGTDNVDPEMIQKPHRWNVSFIRNFMAIFGSLSSIFDYLTFGVLILVFQSGETLFRTGWFIESVISASVVVLVIRTRRPIVSSKPSKYLLATTLAIALAAVMIPFVPFEPFQFTQPPVSLLAVIVLIVAAYIASAEMAKRIFYRRVKM